MLTTTNIGYHRLIFNMADTVLLSVSTYSLVREIVKDLTSTQRKSPPMLNRYHELSKPNCFENTSNTKIKQMQ